MKKTLRIILLLTLLCQYMIPVTTMAQENSSVNSSEYNDSYSSFEESQKESTKETSVNQTDEKLQSSSEELSISSSEPSSEEQSNAPPKLRLKRASSENGPVGPNISTGPKVIGKIVDAPYVKILSEGQIIDAKYSFTPVFASETTVKYVENGLEKNLGSQNTAYIRKNTVNSSQNTYVEFNNIGYYNGRKIGMRVVPTEFSGDEFQIVVKNTPVNGVGTLGDFQPGSIKNTPSGLAPTLEYQFFYVDTEEPAEISGHFNMGQLDLQEWLAFYPESNIVDSLVVGNNVLNEIELPNGAVTGVARQSTDGKTVSLNDPRNTFSVTFGPTTKVKLKAGAERSGNIGSTIGFSRLFPGSFSDPDPSKQVEDKKLEDKKANFVVTQLLPNRAVDNKYNHFLFEDKIEEILNIDNVKVYNGLGADVSTSFDIKIVGQNITVTAKSNFLSDMNNYGQYYKMRIETTLKDNLRNEQILKYKKGTNLEVPNLASRTFDDRKVSTNEVIAKYSGIFLPGEATGEKLVNGQTSSTSYVGDVVTYTIRLNHTKGTGEWTGSIKDKLPEHMSYQAGTTTLNGTAVKDEDVWKEGTLTVPNITVNDTNETAEVTFKAKINKEALGTTVKNKAEATPNTPTDPNDPNNPNTPDIPEVPSKVVPSAGKLATEKTVYDKDGNSVGNQKVKVGDIIEYRINAKNTEGTETIVNNVKISDEIPAGLSYQAGSLKVTMPDGSTKTLSDEQVNGQTLVTGDLGNLKGGEGVTVSFKVKVTEKATGMVTNVATVDGNVPPPTPGEPDIPLTPERPEVPVGVPGEATGEKLVNGQTSSTSYVGDVVTYTIRLNHTKGTGEWTGSIKDKLPEHMSYQAGTTTLNGTAVKDEDVWKEGTLTVPNITVNDTNETAEVTFKAKINKEALGTTVKNKAEATPNTPTDPNDPNNPNTPDIPEVPSKVVPLAGKLATEKTVYDKDGNSVGNQKVKVGDIIEYRINAKNTEGAKTIVNNVKISDEIPAGLSYQAGSLKVTMPDGSTKTLSDEQVNGQTLVTGDLGNLKGGEGVTVSFKVKVTEKATGMVTNVATVDGNVPPPTPGEPDIPLTPERPEVPVGVPGEATGEKLVNGQTSSTSYVGDVVTYTIRLNHTKGTGEWTGSIKDKLPEHMSYQAGTTTLNGTAVKDEDVWKEGTLTVPNITVNDTNETAEVTFKAKINKEALGTTVKNKAEATPNTPTDPNDPNNPNTPDIPEVPSKVVPLAGKLATEKTVYDKDGNSVGNQKVKVGDIIEYRINAKNTEGAETIVNNVKISDEIPAGLSYQAGSLKVTMPDGSTKTLSDEQVNGQTLVTGDLGNLKGGEGVTVSFKVKVTEKATGMVTNVATVDGNVPPPTPGEPDIPLTPERPEVPVGVPGEATGEKLVNGQTSSTSYVGDVVTYTIRLNHTKGTGEWTGSIKDKLPEHMSYQAGTTTLNGTAVKDEDVWKEGTLTVPNITVNDTNETAEVTFKAKINKEALGTTVKNKAEATPNTPTDPNDPNNPNTPDIPEVPSKVVPLAGKLATEKTVYDKDGNSVGNQKVKVGDIIEYRINAKNTEGAETIVNNVKISDEIPAGLSYQAGSLKVTMPDGSTKTLSDEQVNGQTLATGDLGSLKGGEGVTVSFKVKVTEKATGMVTNVATVDGNVPPTTPGEPDIPLTPEKPRVVINISKKKGKNTSLNVPPRNQENLPSTGEKLSYILPVSGVIILLFVAGYKLKRRK